jgi:RNA polymerase sigma factor (sigma-70 family)
MGNSPDSRTSPTLLGRLGSDPTDQAAWTAFVTRYGPRIYGWCRQWRMQAADAEEVTQTVLVKLAQQMRSFSYDASRSFRGWLKVLTHNALSDYLKSRQRAVAGSGAEEVLKLLHSIEARDDLTHQLEEEFDCELLEHAMQRVRLQVAPAKWDVFRLTALEGKPGSAVAMEVGMKVSTVFVVRSKVQKLIREELARLESHTA